MVEIKLGPHTVDAPFMLRLFGITEKAFDRLAGPDTKAELTDGEMIVHCPTAMLHDDVSNFLRELMNGYAGRKKLGRAYGPSSLFRPAKGRRFAPDVYFLRAEHMPSLRVKIFLGVPDQIVEVLSTSNRNYDLDQKRPIYRQLRVPEIWMIDPDRGFVLVDQLMPDGAYETSEYSKSRVESHVIPGFWFQLSWLLQYPPPDVNLCLGKIFTKT